MNAVIGMALVAAGIGIYWMGMKAFYAKLSPVDGVEPTFSTLLPSRLVCALGCVTGSASVWFFLSAFYGLVSPTL